MTIEHTNVIDFFSQRPYAKVTEKDHETIDNITNEYGVYLGVLKKWDSDALRRLIREIDFKLTQRELLTNEINAFQSEYDQLFAHCLDYMKLPKTMVIDDDKDTFTIDKGGHLWIVYNYDDVQNEYFNKKR